MAFIEQCQNDRICEHSHVLSHSSHQPLGLGMMILFCHFYFKENKANQNKTE